MNRLDVYAAVHKMQRARLFALTVEAGKSDPSDALGATRLAAAVDALADELVAHGEHEDRFIHPLLREHAPEIAVRLDDDHVGLDAKLDRLRHVASACVRGAGDPNDLYRALATFTTDYLGHVAIEEAEALPALWESCSDEELMGILASFRGSRSDAENLASLLAQLPTLNPPEIARMVAVGLGSTPISDIAELLGTILSPMQHGALRRRSLTA